MPARRSKQASRKLLSAILVQSEKAAGASAARAGALSKNEKVVQSRKVMDRINKL
jgi:hypothetical protein